jgi:hypothetical protein
LEVLGFTPTLGQSGVVTLGYNIEEDFENDFDENPYEDLCPPLDEGTSDSEEDLMEAPQKQQACTSKLVA